MPEFDYNAALSDASDVLTLWKTPCCGASCQFSGCGVSGWCHTILTGVCLDCPQRYVLSYEVVDGNNYILHGAHGGYEGHFLRYRAEGFLDIPLKFWVTCQGCDQGGIEFKLLHAEGFTEG